MALIEPKKKERRQMLVVSHTHWDREWYLPYQSFRVRLVGLHQVQHAVEQPHELQPEALERQVPLAVPVRVGDQVDDLLGCYLTEPASRPCTK